LEIWLSVTILLGLALWIGSCWAKARRQNEADQAALKARIFWIRLHSGYLN